MNETIEVALQMARCGIATIPCIGKRGIGRWSSNATTFEEQIVEWFEGKYAGYNLGSVVGTSFLVVDNDSKKDGPANWLKLVASQDNPKTLRVLTPTGGEHLYFRIDPSVVVRSTYDFFAPEYPGIDVWSGSHISILPPSIHPDVRKPYRFAAVPDWSDPNLIADCPAWIVERVSTRVQRVVEGRHPKLVSLAAKMRADCGSSLDEIVMGLRWLQADLGFEKPLKELRHVAAWAVRNIPFEPGRVSELEAKKEAAGQAMKRDFAAALDRHTSERGTNEGNKKIKGY